MCRALTESLLIGCLTGSTWNPKIQIKYVDTKNQLVDILTKGSFSRDEWDPLLCLFNIMCFSTFWQPAPCDWCHVETRTRHNLEWWVSDGKSPCNTNLVLQGQCKEGVSSQASGSPVNLENEFYRKRVSLATGNRVVLVQTPKLEVPKCIDSKHICAI